MLNKVLHRDVPEVFHAVFDEYSYYDEGFLRNAMANSDQHPSLACMIADVYARRNGEGSVEKQSKLLFEAYGAYVSAIFDFRQPVVVASREICKRFGAESSLCDLGIADASACIGADMVKLRAKLLNYPVINADEIFVNDFAPQSFGAVNGNVMIETEQCMIAASANSYDYGCKKDVSVIDNLRQGGFLAGDSKTVCVIDYLIEPKDINLKGQQIYYSVVYDGVVDLAEAESETDLLLKDTMWFLSGLKDGVYIEQPSPAQRAWGKYFSAKSPSKIKSLSSKLSLPRQYTRS